MLEPQDKLLQQNTQGFLSKTCSEFINLLDEVTDCVFGLDEFAKVVFVNQAAFEWLRVSGHQEVIGCQIEQLIRLQESAGVSQDQENLLAQDLSLLSSRELNTAYVVNNGKAMNVKFWIKTNVKSDCPTISLFGFHPYHQENSSLSDLKLAIDRYHSLVTTTNAVLWELDLASKSFTFVSPQATVVFGYDIEDWYLPNFWFDTMHEEDREQVYEACERLSHESDAYQFEYRMFNAHGEILHIRDYVYVLRDETGPYSLRGVFVDCTKERKLEQELRLNATVFNTAEAVAITDIDAQIIKVNKAFTAITGYEQQEIIGQNLSILKSGKQDEAFYQAFWNSIHEHGRWQGEIWNKRKNGEVYPEWLTVSSVIGENGDTEYFIAVFTDISKRKQDEQKIIHQANYDQLTGLPNRGLLNERLSQAIEESKRCMFYGALLLLDIDNFRMLNDSLGHNYGDELLTLAAKRLEVNATQSDLVARTGGDEFAILIPAIGTNFSAAKTMAHKYAEGVLGLFAEHFEIAKQAVHFSVSIGIAVFPTDGDTNLDVLRQADTAMYRSKAAGRNQVRSFSMEMYEEVERKHCLYNELKIALEADQLELYYQPVFSSEHRIIGVEALSRWNHSEQGFISPAEFIPIAEQTGLIIPLSSWVLETALNQMAAWLENGWLLDKMAINISSQRFSHPDFLSEFNQIVKRAKVDPKYIELEITEEVMVADLRNCINVFKSLQKMGVSLSVDDFGTGYSSLGYLSKLPIDKLKIDQAFVRNLPHRHSDVVIVDTIISMATNLGFSVTAEGVETQEQLEYLLGKKCDYYQGFHLGKPMPEKGVSSLLKLQFDNS